MIIPGVLVRSSYKVTLEESYVSYGCIVVDELEEIDLESESIIKGCLSSV